MRLDFQYHLRCAHIKATTSYKDRCEPKSTVEIKGEGGKASKLSTHKPDMDICICVCIRQDIMELKPSSR